MARLSRSAAARLAWRAGLALALLLIVCLASQPWWLGAWMGHRLSASSHRSVHFDSMRIGLDASLQPVAVFRGVDIANAEWAATQEPFAKVGELVVTLSWRSIAERRPVLALVRLHDGIVNLEQLADGSRNWRLIDPEDRGPGRYKVLALQAERSSVHIVNRAIGLDLHTAAQANTASPDRLGTSLDRTLATPALPTRIDFSGTAGRTAFRGSAATGPVLTFVETGQTFDIQGYIEASGVRLEANGKAGDILRAPRVDAEVKVAGESLAALGEFFAARYPAPRPFSVNGRLTLGDGRYALAGATARVGKTDLRGDLAYVAAPSRRAVQGRLESDSADLADLEWLAGRSPARPRSSRLPAQTAPTPAAPFEFARLQDIDVDVGFTARRFRAAQHPALSSLSLQGGLQAGLLSLTKIDVGYAGGHATGELSLDARSQPTRVSSHIAVRDLAVARLLPSAGRSPVSGNLHGAIELASAGESMAAWLANASGSVAGTVSNGTISSKLDAQLGLEMGKMFRTLISGDAVLPLPCAALTLDLRSGNARVRTLVLESRNTRVHGTGTIDLRSGNAIDLVLTPSPLQPGLFDQNRSIRLTGPLRKFQRSLVERPAKPSATACSTKLP